MVREKIVIRVQISTVLETDGVDTMEQILASNIWEHKLEKGTARDSVLKFLKVVMTAMEQKFRFL